MRERNELKQQMAAVVCERAARVTSHEARGGDVNQWWAAKYTELEQKLTMEMQEHGVTRRNRAAYRSIADTAETERHERAAERADPKAEVSMLRRSVAVHEEAVVAREKAGVRAARHETLSSQKQQAAQAAQALQALQQISATEARVAELEASSSTAEARAKEASAEASLARQELMDESRRP